nr:hypothetical protein [Tanacetum cinerariifolium]
DKGPIVVDEDPAAGDEGLAAGVEGPGTDDERHGVDDKSHGLDDDGHSVESDGLGLEEEEKEEAVPEGQQQAAPVVRTIMSVPLGLRYGALRCQDSTLEDDHVYSTFEVGQGSGSAPEFERPERVSASRQPILTTWTDPEDDMVYIDVLAYPPPALPIQTPPFLEWTSGLLPISPSPSVVPSPASSPMILLTVPSPVATPTTADTEGFWTELGAQVEMQRRLIRDHAVRLEELSPLYSRGRVDTWMTDMSWTGYDDHRLVHDMLLQHTALQREPQEMIGRVTALEQERDHRERNCAGLRGILMDLSNVKGLFCYGLIKRVEGINIVFVEKCQKSKLYTDCLLDMNVDEAMKSKVVDDYSDKKIAVKLEDTSMKYGEAYLNSDMANKIREWNKVIDLVPEDEVTYDSLEEDEDWSVTMKYQDYVRAITSDILPDDEIYYQPYN